MRYSTVRDFALSLPEATEAPHHHMTSFRVRGKIFATVPPERDRVHLFVDETAREEALELHPAHVEKLLWGGKVAGVRMLLAAAPADVVKSLLRRAWRNKAPKSLLAAQG